MWEESELSIEGIDFDKLCKYLAIHLKKEEITEEGFEELLYKKKPKEKKKKQKVTKKIGRKHKKRHTLDTNRSGGADTLDTSVKKQNDTDKKKKKTVANETSNKKGTKDIIW